jgi:DNA helicase-2/ATP-dependent DNA helicase PcrA
MTFVPSTQQQAIFAAIRTTRGGNLLVRARAGTGKTTTMVQACQFMSGSVAFCAYNKPVAEEIKVKVAPLKNVKAGTFHSFGYLAWSKHIGTYLKPNDKKVTNIIQDPARAYPEWAHEFIAKLVSLAKMNVFGLNAPIEACDYLSLIDHYDVADTLPETVDDAQLQDAIRWTQEVLTASNNLARTEIDFDDQLYLPLLFNARMWQNDWVIIDEAQDTNPARRMLARKMLRPGGRLVAVGDDAQAIYGFTGANNDALDLIKREFACREFPLTVTYRCGKAIVREANQFVADYEAHPSNGEGQLSRMTRDAFGALPADQLTHGMAVLCRNTAPLVDAAFQMIGRGIGCHIEGKDIGAGLVALAFRWKRVKSFGALRDKLQDYLSKQSQKLLAKGKELQAAGLEDKVNALLAIMDGIGPQGTMDELKGTIMRMFGNTQPGERPNTIVLSTVHKSKGREWDRVFILGREQLMPSRYARQDWQVQQEQNLIYVAVTRAKAELVDVDLEEKKRRG